MRALIVMGAFIAMLLVICICVLVLIIPTSPVPEEVLGDLPEIEMVPMTEVAKSLETSFNDGAVCGAKVVIDLVRQGHKPDDIKLSLVHEQARALRKKLVQNAAKQTQKGDK